MYNSINLTGKCARHPHVSAQLWTSPLVRESEFSESGNFCLWSPESGKKKISYGIRNPGSWNPEYSTRNPKSHLSNDWNPESKFYRQHWNRMPGTWNPEYTAWNPETKTVLDSLSYMGRWPDSSEIYVYENKFEALILLIFPRPKGIPSQNIISIVSCMGAPRCRASLLTIRNGGKETFWPW